MSFNVTDANGQPVLNYLSWIDYLVFSLMLCMSAGIGIFFGCFGSKMKTTADFLVGGRNMGLFPVVMSLIASFMSAIGLLGVPSDIYTNGVTFFIAQFGFLIVMPAVAFLYLPVFWKLQVTSANEYLEIRFSKGVRLMGSILFLFQMSFYMAIAVYAPSLALAQMTGLHLHLSISLICFVCMFYTTLGGIKAVMWTDVLQALFMYGAMVYINVTGTIEQGGINKILEDNLKNGRPGFGVWDLDPRVRYTIWNMFIGTLFTWTSIYGVNQTQVQRYMSLGSKSLVIKALMINGIGLVVLGLNTSYAGMILYSKYQDCDPIASGFISKSDQILPYYVMQNFGHIVGLPGLFIAAVFAGALSTISSGINSLAAIALEDFVKGYCVKDMSDRRLTHVTKGLNFYFGLQTFALTFVAEQLGDVLAAAISLFGLIGGPLLGIFSLGMFIPFGNTTGAYSGTVVSFLIVGWITFGYHVSVNTGFIVKDKLPTNICPNTTISSIVSSFTPATIDNQDLGVYEVIPSDALGDTQQYNFLREMYQVSFMWYSFYGFIIFMLVAIPVSKFFGQKQDIRKLDPGLLSPFVSWFKFLYPGYSTIGADLDITDEPSGSKKQNNLELNGETNPGFEDPISNFRERKNSRDTQTNL